MRALVETVESGREAMEEVYARGSDDDEELEEADDANDDDNAEDHEGATAGVSGRFALRGIRQQFLLRDGCRRAVCRYRRIGAGVERAAAVRHALRDRCRCAVATAQLIA